MDYSQDTIADDTLHPNHVKIELLPENRASDHQTPDNDELSDQVLPTSPFRNSMTYLIRYT